MKTRLTKTGTRRGFTLVEMMVAMAISLGIMLILAEAFKSALDFVRIANANAQLMNQLSGAGNMLEHDLLAEHFLSEPGKPNGGVKLSDQWLNTTPKGGFFHIDASAPQYLGFTDREGNTLSN
ncbi:MAG TPA: prepilin-type N-terminal cleavage/methylation domain-containing protein, partial [Gemmata sp.]|nr:prepilin-type N-terminal cleavage/methylation domain-containing protein [Gemmata sp.]